MKLNRWLGRTDRSFRREFPQDYFSAASTELADIAQDSTLLAPMRLAVITQFFPPDFAATGQLLDELVRHLDRQGVEVEVFTGQPGYAYQTDSAQAVEQVGAVRIRRSRSSQLFSQQIRGKAINGILFWIRSGLHLIRAFRHHHVFLITTAPPFLPILGYFANLLFGISYVCLLYDLYPDIAVELGVVKGQHWLARFWRAVNCRVWRRARGIIVLSPNMKQRIISHCPEIADKISVIHSWADPELITPIAKQENWFAQEHDLVDRFTVLYSGNMGRCHDLDTILEAAQQLQGTPVRFVCIGGGAQRKKVMAQVEKLGLDNFLFLPYQTKQVLPYSLTACDLSLVSMDEGMEELVAPSKLYPAMSTGRPLAVICPRRAYLHQLIADANCGATFENRDAQGLANFIKFLMNDRQQAERMGRAGRQYLQKHFTPQEIAKQYVQVLRRAMV
jgi:glycosyltransferase involved in cell wall biosynthesis